MSNRHRSRSWFTCKWGKGLDPRLAQRVSEPQVRRVIVSIGPNSTMHFQTCHDKAGNAKPLTDPTNGLVVPNLKEGVDEDLQGNLIMPEPCRFLSPTLPVCSVIRPTETNGIAMGVVNFLTALGLFIGQSPEFFNELTALAQAADAAKRE